MGYLWITNILYITSKGNYETVGDGMYRDMDRINMGSVFDKTLLDILEQYGKITYGSKKEYKKLLKELKQE